MPSKQARVIIIVALALLAFGIYQYWALRRTYQKAQAQFTASTTAWESELADKELAISRAIEENTELREELKEEKERNGEFEEQINEIAGTVGTLEKLSKTDKELLQKYSKVYFLNEHYVPPRLSPITPKYLIDETKVQQIHDAVWPKLEELLEEALEDEINLYIVSAYRSFGTQASLKSNYVVRYGSGANQFSADQGYSEHQLGTTVDFTTTGLGGGLNGFETTAAYKWLQDNAHRFGFVLSYPPNNAYYQFEPWHWRYVGEDLARDLRRDGKFFYDLEQREIDKYLISIFD